MEASEKEATHPLDPWYITGLVEGEGCFSVSFSRREKLNTGIETRPSFSISLNRRNLALLQSVHRYFGCGGVRFSRSDRTYKYEVRSIKDLVKRIIPHFQRHPLHGEKAADFERFAEICRKVNANLHRNREHLKSAYAMNASGTRRNQQEDLLRVLGEEKG
jgi:hypothetical protein